MLIQGEPTGGVFVLFIPVDEPAGTTVPRPRAYTKDDGTFELETYGAKDGAPAGEYYVMLTWSQTADGRDDGEDKLKGRYANAYKSGIKAKVTEGPNELQPFKLLER